MSLFKCNCMDMECVIQFSVVSTIIYTITFCTFQVGKFFTSFWHRSACLCVFYENCFCITQFLTETVPQISYTRVAYNLLHLFIYCFHLPSTSLWSFVVFSCSNRNFTPFAPINTFRRASNCAPFCLRVTTLNQNYYAG